MTFYKKGEEANEFAILLTYQLSIYTHTHRDMHIYTYIHTYIQMFTLYIYIYFHDFSPSHQFANFDSINFKIIKYEFNEPINESLIKLFQ